MEIGARRQKAMNSILGDLNLSPRPLFHKVPPDHLHVNHLGAFFTRHILESGHPKLVSLTMRLRAGLSITS